MSLSEHEQHIIEEIEFHDFYLPALKEDAKDPAALSAILISTGVGVWEAGRQVNDLFDGLGRAPELTGATIGLCIAAAGTLALVGSGVNICRYQLEKRRHKG